MVNLIIGLFVGVLSASALLVMWRMVNRLGDEAESQTNEQN